MSTIVSLPLPITLLNGTVADAGQVMQDLNAIASNVNANAAKNGVNSDITQLLALTTIGTGLTITGAFINSSQITNSTIIGSTIDATTTGVTQPVGTSNTTLATTEFVSNVAFSTALPAQAGNAGKFITTNGTTAFWSFVPLGTSTTGQLPISQGGSGGFSGAPDFLLIAQGVI